MNRPRNVPALTLDELELVNACREAGVDPGAVADVVRVAAEQEGSSKVLRDGVVRHAREEAEKALHKDDRAGHLPYVVSIAQEDAAGLVAADPKYGFSWKRRGGPGAFYMLARKWDRLEHALAPHPGVHNCSNLGVWCGAEIPPYDVLTALLRDRRAEGTEDDVRDLRRYLMLVEAEGRRLREEAADAVRF